jgi:hypothetical protein
MESPMRNPVLDQGTGQLTDRRRLYSRGNFQGAQRRRRYARRNLGKGFVGHTDNVYVRLHRRQRTEGTLVPAEATAEGALLRSQHLPVFDPAIVLDVEDAVLARHTLTEFRR